MNQVVSTVEPEVDRDNHFLPEVRGSYTFWSREPLPEGASSKLLEVIRDKGEEASAREYVGVLGGRAVSRGDEVHGLGRVFVKKYAHGGLLRGLTAARFIAVGACRSEQEFAMLEKVRSLGIRAPKPLVFVKKGTFLYSTWLVMEELQGVRSLVELSINDPDALRDSMQVAGEQIAVLIRNRILHIDLHPGNILVDENKGVYIVDFDKARNFSGSAWALRDMYLRRWRRAVLKHKLSPILTELMSLSLRSYSE